MLIYKFWDMNLLFDNSKILDYVCALILKEINSEKELIQDPNLLSKFIIRNMLLLLEQTELKNVEFEL